MKTLIPVIKYHDGHINVKFDLFEARGTSGLVESIDDILDCRVYGKVPVNLRQNPLSPSEFSGYVGSLPDASWLSVETPEGWSDFELGEYYE